MIRMDITYPDFETFRGNIHAEGNINYIDAEKFSNIVYSYAAREETCIRNIQDALNIMLKLSISGATRDTKYNGLLEAGIPAKIFKDRKKTSGVSLDAEHMGKACEYIETSHDKITDSTIAAYNYMKWTSEKSLLSTTINRAKGAISDGLILPSTEVFGWDGKYLLEAGNIYNQRVTGRFYPKNLSITSLPLALRQCFVAPAGQYLAAFDFRQIDLEVMYNIFLRGYYQEQDIIFDDEPEDKYMAIYKMVCIYGKIESDDEYYLANRSDIKTVVLATAYGGQVSTLFNTFKDKYFCQCIREMFDNHAGYKATIDKILCLVELDCAFQVKDYFGFKLDIPISERVIGVGNLPLSVEQIIKYAISYIVQSTSNSIYTNWVNHVMSEFEKAGCSDKITVALSVFDEAVFRMTEDAVDFFYIIRNALRIQIADWDPIRLKPELYIHYKDREYTYPSEDALIQEFSDRAEKSCVVNANLITNDIAKGEHYNASMIPTVHTVYIFSTLLPDEILQEEFGVDINDLRGMSDLEMIADIDRRAKETGSKRFHGYSEICNRFVLVNANSGKEYKYHDINSLPNLLSSMGILYVNVFTIHGDGFTIMGEVVGVRSSLQPSVVYEKLTDGDWSTN